MYTSHRTHGAYLAKGGDLGRMLCEMHCRINGCVGSRGGSMHLIDKSVGMAGTSAIVGGAVPIATGAALAAKMKGEDRVVVVFLGDATTEEGVTAESLNFAALKKLPVIFFCENNFYSVQSPLAHATAAARHSRVGRSARHAGRRGRRRQRAGRARCGARRGGARESRRRTDVYRSARSIAFARMAAPATTARPATDPKPSAWRGKRSIRCRCSANTSRARASSTRRAIETMENEIAAEIADGVRACAREPESD